mmetsp:Transcript_3879/g.7782  ORF Transcript_3879/g.7782 Transcript_3879/m.7782 type:complete len:224 (+) Transcript_3879:84-755(+)|eukprot:CAMPEP_0172710394 /NCGR_PEP_ID=MMETSP1074-20121228/55632_1 /TAXON_ID=2916 /ORGANISM="Ceratium fusus, Strain PA161109" /LENGTH=223 /DNA_ID=CAMNT_0013533789 /DNA_START=86 /DNA_END=757 /DNA_ORIENTATION=+
MGGTASSTNTQCCCVEDKNASEVVFQQSTLGGSELVPQPALVPSLEHLGEAAEGARAHLQFVAGGRSRLRPPPDFTVRSEESTISCGSKGCMNLTDEEKKQELERVQILIKGFVKEVLVGLGIEVVLEDGRRVPCRFCMDCKLATVTLHVHGAVRDIPMTSIQDICSGKELRNIETTTPVDENCVTLVMGNDQCVSFHFRDVATREHFATCMKVLRLAVDEGL